MLVVLSLIPIIPQSLQPHLELPAHQIQALPHVVGQDPNGTLVAFNASRAQFDLYTQQNASSTGGTPPTWFGGNFTNVSGTGFNVTIPLSTSATENVTWPKVNIPHGNFSSTTYLRFDWRGNLGNGTRASYLVYNGTRLAPVFNVTKVNQTTITGGPPSVTAGTPPVSCGPTDECLDVSRFIGFNLTLTFLFNSTSTGKRLSVRVSDIEVASADLTPISSFSHSMKFDPTNSTRVLHNADLTLQYNATVTYRKPNTTTGHLNHTWAQMVIAYYYPNSYQQISILQNGTALLLATPIAQGKCSAMFCTNSQFIALNMTTPNAVLKANINIAANTANLEAGVQTTLGGVPTNYWGPGDLLQVKVNIRQGVNVTGSNIVSGNKTGIVRLTQTFTTKKGISLENFTNPLPQDASALGLWTVNSTFINGYDYGFNSTSFTLEQLGITGFTYSGSNQLLTAGGTLTYASTSLLAPNVNGYVFAVDSGSGAAPLSTPTITSGTGIYVSNVTLLNGVFTAGGQLIMTFTLVNPTKVGMEANLTIDHEWVSNVSHGSNATILVPSGSDTFTLQADYVYRLNATFTPAGIHIIVKGISSGGNSVSATLPPGNPPVTSLRQHSGLFKITVISKPVSALSPCVPACSNSLESPAYAYVLVNPPLPGRLLASGSFTSTTAGVFSTTISSGNILGASRLIFLSLGRDPNGLAITVQGKSTQESTILQSSVDNIPTVTENQAVTIVLHLTSNSTVINMNLTISLNVEGRGVVQSQSGILIPHGTTKDVSFNFNAPPNVGVYTLTFFSPDYGAPLITGTLQVSVLQSSLQVIIPAIIGVVAAIVILLFFLFRKKPEAVLESPRKEKPTGGKPAKPNPGSSSSKSLT
jgi:hypothetical protein